MLCCKKSEVLFFSLLFSSLNSALFPFSLIHSQPQATMTVQFTWTLYHFQIITTLALPSLKVISSMLFPFFVFFKFGCSEIDLDENIPFPISTIFWILLSGLGSYFSEPCFSSHNYDFPGKFGLKRKIEKKGSIFILFTWQASPSQLLLFFSRTSFFMFFERMNKKIASVLLIANFFLCAHTWLCLCGVFEFCS